MPDLRWMGQCQRSAAEAREHGDIGQSRCNSATLPHIGSQIGIENVARKQIAFRPISQAKTNCRSGAVQPLISCERVMP